MHNLNGAVTAPIKTADPDAELLVLAAMEADPDLISYAVELHLTPEDFTDSGHRALYSVLVDLINQQMQVDSVIIQDELMKRGFEPNQARHLGQLNASIFSVIIGKGHLALHVDSLKAATYRRLAIEIAVPVVYERIALERDPAKIRSIVLGTFDEYLPAVDRDGEELEDPNPLAVAKPAQLSLGWIDEYANLMTTLTGSPVEFNRLCGLVTAAAVIQRRAVLRMSFDDIYPNIYGAIVARSSVYHKSSALAKPRGLLKRAMLDRLLMSELGTSEGLLKQLATQGAGMIVRDEIGTLFASHHQKHLLTLKPDLTALFDCKPYSRRLSNDAVVVNAPYLNILGATTPARFYEGVSFVDWADGFLARWLFVLPEGEPDFDATTGTFTQEHDQQIGRLAVALVNIDRQRDTDFRLAEGVHEMWDAWQRETAKRAYVYGDDVISAVTTRYAAYALKFAIILAAVNDSWGVITQPTMETAIQLASMFKANVHKLLSEKANYGMSGSKLQKVFRVIKNRGKETGATRKVIQQYANISAGDLNMCLETMLQNGYIMEDSAGRATRYIALIEKLPTKVWR